MAALAAATQTISTHNAAVMGLDPGTGANAPSNGASLTNTAATGSATSNQANAPGAAATPPYAAATTPAMPPAPPAGAAPRAAAPRPGAPRRAAATPCVFFAKGTCRNGARCPFVHGSADKLSAGVADLRVEDPDSPSRRPSGAAICRFYARGLCRSGTSCRFSHGDTQQTDTTPALSAETSLLLRRLETGELPMFALDVECVATGTTHNDRSVAQIGLVDAYGRCVLNVYVKPTKAVVSYLTPLTGLTEELIEERGVSMEEAITALKARLPTSAAVVGTNIGQDARWLGLRSPEDCALFVDLAALFRAWDGTRYVYFNQDHCAKVWLGAVRPPGVSHDAVGDAAVSMALLGCYMRMPDSAKAECHARALATPRTPSFAVKNPSFEGVCQGNRRLCTCGAVQYS